MVSPGENFSHYKIISAIGSGGMGEVFLALDTKLDRQIALKVLLSDVADDEERVRRFEQEAKAASALNHPNILTVFEIGAFDNSHYIATEFIKGQTLRELMQGGAIRLRDAFNILLQVTAALGAAHDAGIIHRDIKPENVMLRGDGLVKVLDFGLAKLISASPASVNTTLPLIVTQPGMLVGTVAYMSPEQARGHDLDPRSDVFSLGIMMFELFTGNRPFDGESHLDLISSILKDEPPALRRAAPELPRQLERIVDKTLRKDRKQRYQNIRDLQIDIEDLRNELDFEEKVSRSSETIVMNRTAGSGVDVLPTNSIKPTLTESISTRRFTLLHAIIFAIAAIGLAGGVWYLAQNMVTSPPAVGSYKTAEVATWNSAPGELFSNATFSPDGKMIAFSSTKSGTKNIWVTQTGSTEAIQTTTDAFANTDPIWSAKGDEIAYFSDRSTNTTGGNNSSGIWRVNALGGTPKLVGPLLERNVELRRWSTNGKIYYQVRNDLNMMDAAGGPSQKVVSLSPEASLINIAADEKAIIYSIQSGEQWRIVSRDLATGKEVEGASGTGKVDSFVWLSDKDRLVYAAAVDGVSQVFVTRPGSGQSTRISTAETDLSVVDVSPDGRLVLTSSAKEESNLWRVNIASGQETPIARDLAAELWPAVSPDNSKIAFQSIKNLSQGNKLFTGSIAVTTIKQRDDGSGGTIIAEQGFLPSWSPDGANIAYGKLSPDSSKELYTVSPNGGRERRLTTNGILAVGYSVTPYNTATSHSFAWSPDSSRIAYLSQQSGSSNVWAVNLHDGASVALPNNIEADRSLFCPVWSKDGKKLAVSFEKRGADAGSKATYGITVINVEGAGSVDIYTSTKSHRLIGWDANGSALVIAEPSKLFSVLPPETTLKRIQLPGGNETNIAVLKNAYFYNMFLSYDQRSIAFAARNDGRDDLWIIPAAGGTARKITSNNDSALYYSRLAWFHDGSSIAFGKQTRFSLLSMITGID